MALIPTLREIEAEFRRDVTQAAWRRPKSGGTKLHLAGEQKELHDDLMALARAFESARAKEIARLATGADVLRRGRDARRLFRSLMGLAPLPPRTPMKPVVRPGWERENYRVERVVFQSRPGVYVTANLYLPKQNPTGEGACATPREAHRRGRLCHTNNTKWPAVLCVQGHQATGKHGYQRTAAELASCGLAAFSIDPLGQGERDEYVDRGQECPRHQEGTRTVPRCCPSHAVAGDPAYLLGTGLGEYRLWDCMRALDYLQSRPDIAASRLGVTGISGGGWEALWLAAVDPRIKAVNSNCYTTTFRRRMENRGQDAEGDPEQDPFGLMSAGLDLGDLLVACCPRPVSLGVAIFDFFPVDGALACYAEAKRLYGLAGAAGRLGIAVEDCGHNLTRNMRKQACEWMMRWLGNKKGDCPLDAVRGTVPIFPDAGPIVDREWRDEPERVTNCTSTGIVLTSLGGKTSAHLNAERARALALARSRRKRGNVAARLRELLRFEPVRAPVEVECGKPRRAGALSVTPMRIRTDGGVWLTAHLWQRPGDSRPRRGYVYVAEKGERYDPFKNAACRGLAASGAVVLDLDPRGMGPHAEVWDRFVPLGEADLNYDALVLGRPLASLRAADILRAVHVLSGLPGVDPDDVGVSGEGYGAMLALFAGVLDPRVARVVERRGLTSWSSLAWHREYAWGVNMMLPGALKHFDLADLRASLALPRGASRQACPLRVVRPLDHLKQTLAPAARIREFAAVARAYAAALAPRAFQLARKDAP